MQCKLFSVLLIAAISVMFLSGIVSAQLSNPIEIQKQIEEEQKRIQEQSNQIEEQAVQGAKQAQQTQSFLFGFMQIILIFAVISLIAFIWVLIDIAKASNDNTWKAIWIGICLFLGIIGAVIYIVVGRKQKKTKTV